LYQILATITAKIAASRKHSVADISAAKIEASVIINDSERKREGERGRESESERERKRKKEREKIHTVHITHTKHTHIWFMHT